MAYRLKLLPIRLPPLRERLPDLEPLADALLDDIARRSALPHRGLSADALDRLAAHDWPGSIRELRNVMAQAALMTDAAVWWVSWHRAPCCRRWLPAAATSWRRPRCLRSPVTINSALAATAAAIA